MTMRKAIIIILCCLVCFASGAQKSRRGIVEFSANFMREKPGFTEELGTQALMGTVVDILDESGYWLKISSPEPYTAWTVKMGVAEKTDREIDEWLGSRRYIFTADYGHVYESPSESGERVTDLVSGDIMRAKLSKKGKAVSEKGFAVVILPSGKEGYVRKNALEDFSSWAEKASATPENIISTAKKFLGTPYFWGGTSIKGVDCSGLVRATFFLNGSLLPRNASQQALSGDPVDVSGVSEGRLDSLEKGDLLFFGNKRSGKISHVGIYIGEGKFIHSSQYVRISSLRKEDEDYYSGTVNLVSGRRVCGMENKGKGVERIARSPYYFPTASPLK